jgi:7,8-dihydropterin-6-yl-methyl-4-(beta-D-ribofuranosyl)aminobenzene 5'-phosphate synthase
LFPACTTSGTWSTSRPATARASPTFAALKRAFGERYLYAGLGTAITLGAIPRPLVGLHQSATWVLDEDDLGSYRLRAPREAGVAIMRVLVGFRERQGKI